MAKPTKFITKLNHTFTFLLNYYDRTEWAWVSSGAKGLHQDEHHNEITIANGLWLYIDWETIIIRSCASVTNLTLVPLHASMWLRQVKFHYDASQP